MQKVRSNLRRNLILVTVVILEKQKKAKSLQAKKVRYFVLNIIYWFFILYGAHSHSGELVHCES